MPAPLFENLDAIRWSTLRHAYGDGSDVPALLRALASDDKEARHASLEALYGNIWHQGTVYEATAPAVPFLIELLMLPRYAEKAAILELLLLIACGCSYHEVHAAHLDGRHSPEELRARVSQERTWVAAAQRAVTEGWPIFVHLLNDANASIREWAAHVAAACQPRAVDTANQLRPRIQREKSTMVRASLILALGVTGSLSDVELLLPSSSPQNDPVLQLAASVAIARLQPDNLPDPILHRLVAAADHYGDVEPLWDVGFAWRDSPLIPAPSAILSTLGPADQKRALPLMLQRASWQK